MQLTPLCKASNASSSFVHLRVINSTHGQKSVEVSWRFKTQAPVNGLCATSDTGPGRIKQVSKSAVLGGDMCIVYTIPCHHDLQEFYLTWGRGSTSPIMEAKANFAGCYRKTTYLITYRISDRYFPSIHYSLSWSSLKEPGAAVSSAGASTMIELICNYYSWLTIYGLREILETGSMITKPHMGVKSSCEAGHGMLLEVEFLDFMFLLLQPTGFCRNQLHASLQFIVSLTLV